MRHPLDGRRGGPRLLAAAGLLSASVAFAPGARAQAGLPAPAGALSVRQMTLPEALAYAREHQPAIRVDVARIAALQAAAGIPRAQWLPSVGATAQLFAATANNTTGTYAGAPFMDVPRIGGTTDVATGTLKPYPTTFLGAGVQQELFDFGRIAAQAAAADARVDVARQSAGATRLHVAFAVEEAYFAVHAAKTVVLAAEQAHARTRVHRDLAKAGVDSGLRSPIELTRAEANLAIFAVGVVRAQAGLSVARNVLAASVGVPDAALDVSDVAPAPRELPSLSDAVKQDAERDPRILEAVARLRAQERETRAIGSLLRPNLAVTSTVSGRAGGAAPSGSGQPANQGGWLPNVPNWDVGLVLSWPIFNGPILATERASRAGEQTERDQVALVRYQQGAAITQAYTGVTVAQAALPALERSVEASRANYAQAEARFGAGLGNAVELADAEALRMQAEIDLALGRFEVARARVAFGRAIAEEP